MPPPDPKEQPDEESGELSDVDALKDAGDIEGLLALAKAHRGKREMKACLDAYRAAADLGSGEAEFAVALFHLSGGVVPQDLKEGAARLRTAADKGSIPARVYLGNLYELGIHYKADPEKADVWYRNAARASKIEEEPGTPEHARALAELGCARYVLALVESGEVDGDDKARLLQRAKIHGYGLKVRSDVDEDANANEDHAERLTFTAALAGADQPATTTPAPKDSDPGAPENAIRPRANTLPATPEAKAETNKEPKNDKATKVTPASGGLAAFGYAILFALAGLGAAYAATMGARELVAHGQPVPVLGATRVHLVFPIVLGVIGVLPCALVYRFGALIKALVAGAALGAVGWIAWGTGQGMLHATREIQALGFALPGFLAALLVLGLLGESKLGPKPTLRPRR